MEAHIFDANDIEPYFNEVTDREQKAKMMEYRSNTSDSLLSDLENELLSMF